MAGQSSSCLEFLNLIGVLIWDSVIEHEIRNKITFSELASINKSEVSISDGDSFSTHTPSVLPS